MKHEHKFGVIIKAISRFFMFFTLIAITVTCCMTLFLSLLSQNTDIIFTRENITLAAKLTFVNVLVITSIFTVIDSVRRNLTTEKHARRIAEATEKMIEGDFNIRIPATAKIISDDKLNEIAQCINKMAEELSGVETLRTDFIANVSHEMKTPLAVIQNYGKLLQTPGLTEEKRIEYAVAVTDASRRLSEMMTNILKLNRLENQQIYPKAERYELGEQLCECLLQYESIWEKRNINIETEIEENVFLCADSELLSLVWNNLFSNAFKFTEDGGTVSLSLHTEGEYAVVKVKDTGCGMTPEIGAHIFEKFYQGDTSHGTQGNGLGLALVKRVIDIIQGEIGVESTPRAGTTFTVKVRREHDELEKNR
ncbi:MAG: HAMP domain-containing histidine kinase [Clostridia bacterium]|nr:HAMP domain-containing histidine kinase [Clostridia bacterium]